MKYLVKDNVIIQKNIELKNLQPNMEIIELAEDLDLFISYPVPLAGLDFERYRYKYINEVVQDDSAEIYAEFVLLYKKFLNNKIKEECVKAGLDEDKIKTNYLLYLNDPSNVDYQQYTDDFSSMVSKRDEILAIYQVEYNGVKSMVEE